LQNSKHNNKKNHKKRKILSKKVIMTVLHNIKKHQFFLAFRDFKITYKHFVKKTTLFTHTINYFLNHPTKLLLKILDHKKNTGRNPNTVRSEVSSLIKTEFLSEEFHRVKTLWVAKTIQASQWDFLIIKGSLH
jgi:hypothetical protein